MYKKPGTPGLNWGNLEKNTCPQCNESLIGTYKDGVYASRCGFKITDEKFRKIVEDRVKKRLSADRPKA